MTTLGLLLAAGAGRRMGTPKALLRDDTGNAFVTRAVGVLRDGGCDAVTVVVGAAADQAAALLDEETRVVRADDWADGMGASLRAGLTSAQDGGSTCAVIGLVDLPDVDAAVVRRMLERVPPDETTLARATYEGRPGHPVLIGRDHWAEVIASVSGDTGARDYLTEHQPDLVECGDIATGRDVDTPDGR